MAQCNDNIVIEDLQNHIEYVIDKDVVERYISQPNWDENVLRPPITEFYRPVTIGDWKDDDVPEIINMRPVVSNIYLAYVYDYGAVAVRRETSWQPIKATVVVLPCA